MLNGNKEDNNVMLCVVKIISDVGSVLIFGDIEKISEYVLIICEIMDGFLEGVLMDILVSFIILSVDIFIVLYYGSKIFFINVFIEYVVLKVVIFM